MNFYAKVQATYQFYLNSNIKFYSLFIHYSEFKIYILSNKFYHFIIIIIFDLIQQNL